MANKVTINTDLLGITWSPGATYRVALDEGFIKEDGGEQANNEANENFYAFTTNSTGPTFTTSTPAPNATGFVDSIVYIQYNRFIRKNTGNIYLYKLVGNTLVSTVSVNDVKVSVSDDILAVDFSGLIWDPVTEYYVLTDSAIVKDYDGFSAVAISNTATLRFTTGLAPAITSTSPAANATAVTNTSTMTFTFDATMAPYATGSIKLYDGFTNSLIQAFSVSGPNVTYSGNNVIVDCSGYITVGNRQYYWLIDANVISSTAGFLFPGVTDSNTYRYTTNPFPSIVYTPADESTGVTNNYFVKMTFASGVVANSGNIKLYETGTNTLKTTIDVTNTAYVSFSGLSCYIDLTGYLKSRTGYYITVDAGAFKTSYGIHNNAITAGTWNFTMDYLLKVEYQVSTPGNGIYDIIGANGNYYYDYNNTNNEVQVRNISNGALLRTISGKFLAAEGTNLLIGEPNYNTGTLNDGRAILYNASTGSVIRTFSNPNPGLGSLPGDGTEPGTNAAGDLFGEYGGISGNLVAISASWENTATKNNTGRVYIFNISTGALVTTLENPDPTDDYSYFGTAISMNSNYLTVGAYLDDNTAVDDNRGAVYIYPTGSGSTAPLRTFNGTQNGDLVGYHLASSGSYSIIGARDGTSTGNTTDYGAVYVYNADTGTYNTLTNPVNLYTSGIGQWLAANSNYFIVVATGLDRAFVYKTDTRTLIKTIYLDVNGPVAASENYFLVKSSKTVASNSDNLLYESNFSVVTSGTPYTASWQYGGLNFTTTGTNPFTGNSARRLTEVVTLGTYHYIRQDFNSSTHPEQFSKINDSESFTVSVYAKAGTSNFINILPLHTASGQATGVGASFNLSNGTTSVVDNATWAITVSASMTSISNGWYRCVLSIRQDLSVSGDISEIWFALGTQHLVDSGGWDSISNDAALVYTGNTANYLDISDAQINTGTTASAYQLTTTSISGGTAVNGPFVIAYKEDV